MSVSPALMVRFRGVFGEFLLDCAFSAPGSGVTALFGPSGSGKTTVLRCIAGLQRIGDGSCTVNGENWQEGSRFVPAHQRAIGYVFQEASLFEHLCVRDNLLFGQAKTAAGKLRLDEIAGLLGLAPLLARAPRALSGGERQRVAIGRALLSQPKLLLMDEPLAALDRAAKEEVLQLLERLLRQLPVPMVYVSHDMAEVERLADHLVLMERGRVLAYGKLLDLQADPALPLMRSRDAAVGLDATAETYDAAYGLATLRVEGGHFLVPTPPLNPGETRRLRVSAGDVSLALEKPVASTLANVLEARIVSATATQPHEMTCVLRLGGEGQGARILCRVTRRSWDLLGLAEGRRVFAQVKAVALVPSGRG